MDFFPKKKEQVPCPKCQSFKVKQTAKLDDPISAFFAFMGTIGCLGLIFGFLIGFIFIPWIIPVGFILFLVGFLGAGIASLFSKAPLYFKCKNCAYEFSVPRK